MTLKRWLVCLTDYDVACLEYVLSEHGLMRKADAVRLSVRGQKERCQSAGYVRKAALLAEQVAVPNRLKGEGGPRMMRWHQLFTDETVGEIEEITARHGLAHKAEAVRLALRGQALADGMTDPPPPDLPRIDPNRKRRLGRRTPKAAVG